jgi:hypothetical protein
MTRALQTWRIDLMRAHPRLFEVMSDEPHLSFGYPNCEEGWREILERLCVRTEAALRDGETFQFVRIRQKFGILRVDWDAEASEDTEATTVATPSISPSHAPPAPAKSAASMAGSIAIAAGSGPDAASTQRAIRCRPDTDLALRTCACCAGGVARPTSITRATTAKPTR